MHTLGSLVRPFCIAVVGLSFVLGLVSPPPALAFDFRAGDEVRVRAGEVIDDDLYIAANSITIEGTVRGDVFAAGRVVTMNGTIEGSLMAAAQAIVVNGPVRDSVRGTAQAAMLGANARIGRDLAFVGYSLEQKAGSTIGRDVAVGGSQVLLAGNVGRNLLAGVESIEVRGSVAGNADVQVGGGGGQGSQLGPMPPEISAPAMSPGLTIAEGAQIGGRLSYTSPREYPIRGRVIGGQSWTQRTEDAPASATPGSVVADYFRRLIVLGLVGLALVAYLPAMTRKLGDVIESRPLPAAGWGLVAVVAFVATVIFYAISAAFLSIVFEVTTLWSLMTVMIVAGALGEALLVSGFFVYVALMAQAIAGYVVGRALLQRVQPTLLDNRIATLLIGLAVFVAVTLVPVLGGLIVLTAALLGLGAAWISVRDRARPEPAPAAALAV